MHLAFCFFSATPVRRFICNHPVLPAGNCRLVAPASQRSVLIKGAGALPVLSVVGTRAGPCMAAAHLSKWNELESSLALLRQVPARTWQFPRCIVSIFDTCALEQSTLKSEFTQSLCVRVIKQLRGGRWRGMIWSFFLRIIVTLCHLSWKNLSNRLLCCYSHFRFKRKENSKNSCLWSLCAVLTTMLRWFHSFCFVHCKERELIQVLWAQMDRLWILLLNFNLKPLFQVVSLDSYT